MEQERVPGDCQFLRESIVKTRVSLCFFLEEGSRCGRFPVRAGSAAIRRNAATPSFQDGCPDFKELCAQPECVTDLCYHISANLWEFQAPTLIELEMDAFHSAAPFVNRLLCAFADLITACAARREGPLPAPSMRGRFVLRRTSRVCV